MFIAHIQSVTGKEHTVSTHSQDVAVLCEAFGAKVGLSNLVRLCGLVHDMGKMIFAFTQYLYWCFNHPSDKSLRGTINHSGTGARYIWETYGKSKDPCEIICAQIVSLVVAGHHGGLPDIIDPDGKSPFLNKMGSIEEKAYEEAKTNFFEQCCSEQELDELFVNACGELRAALALLPMGIHNREHRPNYFYIHLVAKYVYSCLIDADRYDTHRFMSDITDLPAMDTGALWDELCKKVETETAAKPRRYAIDDLRKECSDACFAAATGKGGVYRLRLPTGLGKTLSSLRFALRHARESKKERIFYIIPFKTIIDQTADTFTEIFDHPGIMLEHHSDIIPEDAVRELLTAKGFSTDNSEVVQQELAQWELMTERYDKPVILTTLVQFFNSMYGSSGSLRRMHRFANSVIVFDEVQTVPQKCIHLFNLVVNFLTTVCRATVVLCSATQPLLENTKYPLYIGENAEMVSNYADVFRATKRVDILPRLRIGGYDPGELSEFILERLADTPSLLAIVNTKKDASALYAELYRINGALPEQERISLFHLSTSLCPAHRRTIIISLSDALGIRGSTQKIVCVSTQMIEAGIDLSFGCVVRALAGLDSIAQAAGRCNRHGESLLGCVYLVNIAGENLDYLPEIKQGAAICEQILAERDRGQLPFADDLLSPSVMDYYYTLFCPRNEDKRMGDKLDYPVHINSGEYYLTDLLNQNQRFSKIAKNEPTELGLLRQAYKTAAKYFEVIDSNTVSVLVPFEEEGKRIIASLNGECKADAVKRELDKAQPYSVNLFRYQFDKLADKGALYPLKNGGVLALRDEFYHKTLGVITEADEMKFLNP